MSRSEQKRRTGAWRFSLGHATCVRHATRVRHDEQRIGLFIEEAKARIDARARHDERPVTTPWEPLNDAMGGGLCPGLHVLVGAPGSGRSQFAHQVALHAAQRGTAVAYVALEMDRFQSICRFVGLLTGIQWSRIYLGNLDPDEQAKVGAALSALGPLPLYLEEGDALAGWGHQQLAALGERLRTRADEMTGDGVAKGTKLFLLILDYLQLVSSEERGRAAYAARSVARRLNGVVLLISSTDRKHYAALNGGQGKVNDDGNPARFFGTGKESGEVGFAADSVLVVKRNRWKGDTPPPEGSIAKIGIAKLRAGAPSWVPLLFDGSRFLGKKTPGIEKIACV